MTTLETDRLLLRPPAKRDAAIMTVWLADFDISKNTSSIPYPYWRAHADAHIAACARQFRDGTGYSFIITRKPETSCIGTIGVRLTDGEFELGYWLGKAYWDLGYATEAGRAILSFAFQELRLDKIVVGHMADNPASGRVVEKLAFRRTGTEMRSSKARRCEVECHRYVLTRDDFLKRVV